MSDSSPVPLYLIPIDDDTRDRISMWTDEYLKLDSIFMKCGELEVPAYRQLADINSLSAKQGREYCLEIEKATGFPTYFYLQRWWGRRKGEEDRLCPGCGKKWKYDFSTIPKNSYSQIDFLCNSCRLVSNLATTNDDERHARIGEYRKRK